MSLVIRALSNDDLLILEMLRTLKGSHAGTGLIHESFDADRAVTYTASGSRGPTVCSAN